MSTSLAPQEWAIATPPLIFRSAFPGPWAVEPDVGLSSSARSRRVAGLYRCRTETPFARGLLSRGRRDARRSHPHRLFWPALGRRVAPLLAEQNRRSAAPAEHVARAVGRRYHPLPIRCSGSLILLRRVAAAVGFSTSAASAARQHDPSVSFAFRIGARRTNQITKSASPKRR